VAVNSNDKPINGLLLEQGFYVRAKIIEVFLVRNVNTSSRINAAHL
jgi:hypothetical protein